MAKFVLRCNRCRTRNTFKVCPVNWTQPRGLKKLTKKEVDRELRRIGGRRCRDCGHASFYLDKERTNRKPCHCNAYHWGPHRPGSPCCVSNPSHNVFRAYREGMDEEDIAFLGLAAKPVPVGITPF